MVQDATLVLIEKYTMKAITLLGSTGSIGTQTLDIVAQNPAQFRIVGLAAGRNVELLARQIRAFRPGNSGYSGRSYVART